MTVATSNIGWIPWALRLPSLLGFVLIDLALVCCLIALCVRSSKDNGFATVNDQELTSLGINWNLGLLWTSLPVLVFRILALYWEWITSPISQRQPYVDLLKAGGAPAAKTVLLDYLAVPMLWRRWTAGQNRHFLVAACSFLTLVLSVGISTLSARLFAVKPVVTTSSIPVLFNTTFEASKIDSNVDWVPIFDTVSAVRVYYGEPLPWTDGEYAFQPYHVQGALGANTNVTASTKAYSAYLNCSVVSNFHLEFKDPTLYMTASDRGCDIDQSFGIAETQKVYFKTSAEISCSASAYYSRLVFTAATYSSSSPYKVDNVTVLSCITDYRTSTGNLDTTVRQSNPLSPSPPTVGPFNPSNIDETRPTLWRVFEQNILSPTTFNAHTLWSTSAFGTLVLYTAQKLGGSQYLTSSVLERAIPQVFSSIYLTVVTKQAFVPLAVPERSTGKVQQLTQRLFTVYWVACIVLVTLVVSLGVVLGAIAHVYSNPTVLAEEPAGLLAHAALLERSSHLQFAATSKEQGVTQVAKNGSKSGWKTSQWGVGRGERGEWVIGSTDGHAR
ncbi:hypothetical protein BCR34DRAFT_485996 [Clohesyomyces aquaticus]|uniref:Uncharacterized protein n=1 Tax=Clohesyomyces aquaticus TaxID=1231657 RepID=A0A1Y1ZK86_9PLEO|nr:hypothetical protein BCR34DRAFT_485996 [Clohesyomyces aquaticus]